LHFKEESIKNSADVVERNRPVITELTNEKQEKENELNALKAELDKLNTQFADLEKTHALAQSEYQESKNKTDILAQKRQSLEQEGFERAKELAIESNRKTVLENDLKNLVSEIATKTSGQNELSKELEGVESELVKLKEEIDSKSEEKSKLTKEIEKWNEEKRKLEAELVKTNRILDSKSNEHTLLTSMIENQEGFPESIKFLSKNWNKEVPVLSDILDVDQDYKGIIEHFLEPYLNYYLVKSVKEASQAIQLLSNSQKGKAQFFLLDRIPAVQSVNQAQKGVSAADVVKVDSKYQGLLNYLLKDVFLTSKSLEELEDDSTYLSTKGSFVKRTQSVSGGSVGLFEGKKIGRKKLKMRFWL